MECLQQPVTKQGKVKMKVIPWHCQQRYQSIISRISLNHNLTSAENTRTVKTLLHNNMCLAKALEVCKYKLARKEKADNVDIINFAGIKLKDLSDNLKKMTICVDETLALLQSHSSTKHDKNFLSAPGVGRDLKRKMRVPSGIEKEVVESLENETDSISKQQFKSNGKNMKSSAKNIKGKSVAAASCKQKSIKKLVKPVIGKLPKNVSQRESTSQNDSQPSYPLDLSANLESFNNHIEKCKVDVGKSPLKKKLTKEDKIVSQGNNKILSLNKACMNVQAIESKNAIHDIHAGKISTDLETEFSLKQPKIVLSKTDLPQTLKKKEPVPLNKITDGLSKKCASSKKVLETLPSVIVKEKVQFLLEEDDDIEILSVDPEPLKRLKKTQKRPLRENTQNFASASKKQVLTFGEALQNGDIMNQTTFTVTAEVHKPPDGFISEKNQDFKSIDLPNMQPTVVLTDIFKCSPLKSMFGSAYQPQISQDEPATTDVIEENPKILYSEDDSNHSDLNIV